LGRNSWTINSRYQTFGYKETKTTINSRLGGWDNSRRWWPRTKGGYDGPSNLDAAISGVHDK
jgi:hypothetical protein